MIKSGLKTAVDKQNNFLDIGDLVTGGQEGIIAYIVTGESEVEHIKTGYYAFADSFRRPTPGDIVIVKINGKNYVRVYKGEHRRMFLVGSDNYRNLSEPEATGVVVAHLAIY